MASLFTVVISGNNIPLSVAFTSGMAFGLRLVVPIPTFWEKLFKKIKATARMKNIFFIKIIYYLKEVQFVSPFYQFAFVACQL